MKERNCRKCGEHIPTRMKIDGKTHHLQNRKFCLKCSPFKMHNTKSDDPSRKNKKYKLPFSQWDESEKMAQRVRTYKRGLERKRQFVDAKGGCCQICGYNKCLRALTFHHRDRSTKKFGFGLNELWSHSIEEIIEEAKKCDLLCMNCHTEVEDSFSVLNETKYRNIIANQKSPCSDSNGESHRLKGG